MFEWLKDYQKLEDEIAFLEFNLERSELELKRWVEGDLSNVKLAADSNGARLEEVIEQIKNELECKQEDMKSLLQLIDSFRGLEHQILKLKYVDGMTLETIAHDLGYSSSHIYKKHAEVIKRIKFVNVYTDSLLTGKK
ncbi:sigma-70 family RNA polymerase sigma factor [Jeotgalibacillus terrae]|uniref:Sigma-70 family RNA polymerase sigma factor n=1 Tax=Jeotgalibacillus terrae TaxID=587735 RepID=A0ABW5ZED9_9BACL|nr:sigma-70 family RNA polymerase sigma factor [Jeotgalibacillus terrae]